VFSINTPYQFGRAALFAGALLVPLLALATERGRVVRVVDGDTIKVKIGRRTETVRLIGIDTPETVDPRRPVEYFGRKASAFVKRMADGEQVQLEPDPECSNRDKYRRLLRYVYLDDGTLLNAAIIAQGYGFAYTKYPFSRMEEFRRLERAARTKGRGLWAQQ
jgi:micrococcal nuclease